jgi:hypothetical protein
MYWLCVWTSTSRKCRTSLDIAAEAVLPSMGGYKAIAVPGCTNLHHPTSHCTVRCRCCIGLDTAPLPNRPGLAPRTWIPKQRSRLGLGHRCISQRTEWWWWWSIVRTNMGRLCKYFHHLNRNREGQGLGTRLHPRPGCNRAGLLRVPGWSG